MTQALPVIDELERVLTTSPAEKHAAILKRVTDLFLANGANITENVASVFDGVIARLIDHVERRALVELSTRLAPLRQAPPDVVQRLAADDDIEIAGPMLAQSERLSDQSLVAIAERKSQSHLSKIADRAKLSAAVTDALVDRGDRDVVSKVAANSGAQLSKTGMSMLVMRASGDDELTDAVGQRPDIPPALFKQLLAHATERARQRLLATAKPDAREAINRVLGQIAKQIGSRTVSRKDYAAAERLVQSFSQDTALTRSKVFEFADGNRIAELVAALSILSNIPIAFVGRLICDAEPFGAMVLCRAINLEWSIAHAVLTTMPGSAGPLTDQPQLTYGDYERLSVPSAQRLLGFWQAGQAAPDVDGEPDSSASFN